MAAFAPVGDTSISHLPAKALPFCARTEPRHTAISRAVTRTRGILASVYRIGRTETVPCALDSLAHRDHDVRRASVIDRVQALLLGEVLIEPVVQNVDCVPALFVDRAGNLLQGLAPGLQAVEVQRRAVLPVAGDVPHAVHVVVPGEYGIDVLHVRVPFPLFEVVKTQAQYEVDAHRVNHHGQRAPVGGDHT